MVRVLQHHRVRSGQLADAHVEKRIEAAAVKVAKQEEAAEKATEGSADVPPGTLVELGEVQVNGDAAPATEPPTGLRRRSIPSTVLSQAASFTDSVLKKRNNPAIKKHLHGVDRYLINSAGYMAFRDQHLDIFSRYAYPLVCTIGCIIYIS